MAHPCISDSAESIWFDKYRVDDAELQWQDRLAHSKAPSTVTSVTVCAPAKTASGGDPQVCQRLSQLENENQQLKSNVQSLNTVVSKLEARIAALELGGKPAGAKSSVNHVATPQKPASEKKVEANDDDDDIDLFGSDDDQAANDLRDKRLKEYADKKSKKPQVIAKSSVVLEVKPWDDETDMAAMEVEVRKIKMDGLLWGASKLAPLAYGIMKLQICCVVEDDKVSIEELQELIEANEELVQSVDIAAFNKI